MENAFGEILPAVPLLMEPEIKDPGREVRGRPPRRPNSWRSDISKHAKPDTRFAVFRPAAY